MEEVENIFWESIVALWTIEIMGWGEKGAREQLQKSVNLCITSILLVNVINFQVARSLYSIDVGFIISAFSTNLFLMDIRKACRYLQKINIKVQGQILLMIIIIIPLIMLQHAENGG